MNDLESPSASGDGLLGMVQHLMAADALDDLSGRILGHFRNMLSTAGLPGSRTDLVVFRHPIRNVFSVFEAAGEHADSLVSLDIPDSRVSLEQWEQLIGESRSHSVEWQKNQLGAIGSLPRNIHIGTIPFLSNDVLCGMYLLLHEQPYQMSDSVRFLSRQFGETVGQILKFKQDSWRVKNRLRTFETLDRFYNGINRLRNWKEILIFCLEMFQELFQAPDGSIMIYNRQADQLKVEHSSTDLKGEPLVFQLGKGVAGTSLERRQVINLPDVTKSPFFEDYDEEVTERSIKSLLCVPLWTSRGPVGVVNLSDHDNYREFDLDRIPGLELLQSRLAAALENVITNQRLEKIANTDELTNIFNRRYINRQLEDFAEQYKKTQKPYSVILVDLDKFKQINDRHGHQMGDRVLQSFARTLEKHRRPGDLVGRFGGDEFIYLMPDTVEKQAVKQAESLIEALETMTLQTETGKTVEPLASLGLASVYNNCSAPSSNGIIRFADRALYRAKETEGITLEIAREELDPDPPDD